MRFARWTFLLAAIYGILVLVPMFFLEHAFLGDLSQTGVRPEFYYGFAGSALMWQIAFLFIGLHPQRYRPLMPVAVLEKAAWALTIAVLVVQGRTSALLLPAALIDGALGVLFVMAWLRSRVSAPAAMPKAAK